MVISLAQLAERVRVLEDRVTEEGEDFDLSVIATGYGSGCIHIKDGSPKPTIIRGDPLCLTEVVRVLLALKEQRRVGEAYKKGRKDGLDYDQAYALLETTNPFKGQRIDVPVESGSPLTVFTDYNDYRALQLVAEHTGKGDEFAKTNRCASFGKVYVCEGTLYDDAGAEIGPAAACANALKKHFKIAEIDITDIHLANNSPIRGYLDLITGVREQNKLT